MRWGQIGGMLLSSILIGSAQACPIGESLHIVSSVTADHTHTILISCDQVNRDPPLAAVFVTSATLGHFHTVDLSASELAAIHQGLIVVVQSSVNGGHSHLFSIQDSVAITSRTWTYVKHLYD